MKIHYKKLIRSLPFFNGEAINVFNPLIYDSNKNDALS